MRVVLHGFVVRGPLGGFAWSSLQYLIGLARLGHDVYFMEDSGDEESCYEPDIWDMTKDPTFGLRFAQESFAGSGLEERWAYYDAHTNTWFGPSAGAAKDIWRSADMFLNLSGCNMLRDWSLNVPIRVFLDMDPVFTHVRHLTEPDAMGLALQHNAFLTFAENIGQAGCSIPDDGLEWLPTRHPVVVDRVPVTPGPRDGNFSTVMQWQSYPDRAYRGCTYGSKALSFGPYLDLPKKVPVPFELAIGGEPAPREVLETNGWKITDPYEASRTPAVYLDFMRKSQAEFTVAKHAYVVTSSGWFSERTATYLASARPVVTQETGFSRWLHADGGVHAFRSPEEAVAAIEDVCSRYAMHARWAREVAQAYFDPGVVLPRLLDDAAQAAGSPQKNRGEYAPVAQMDRAGDS